MYVVASFIVLFFISSSSSALQSLAPCPSPQPLDVGLVDLFVLIVGYQVVKQFVEKLLRPGWCGSRL